jgi:hypothetical protein
MADTWSCSMAETGCLRESETGCCNGRDRMLYRGRDRMKQSGRNRMLQIGRDWMLQKERDGMRQWWRLDAAECTVREGMSKAGRDRMLQGAEARCRNCYLFSNLETPSPSENAQYHPLPLPCKRVCLPHWTQRRVGATLPCD